MSGLRLAGFVLGFGGGGDVIRSDAQVGQIIKGIEINPIVSVS